MSGFVFDDAIAAMARGLFADEPIGAGEPLSVTKHSATVQVTRDYALDYGLVKPTTAERRQREAWHAEWEQRKAAATEAWPVFVAALAAVTDPVGRAVLDLHKADRQWCAGCEGWDNAGESPAWPCDTVEAVAKALGITVPPDLDIVSLP